MGIPINWQPTTASLRNIHDHLTTPEGGWPEPRVDVPPITDEQRRRARRRWSNRVRATYVSTGQATHLCQQLIARGAPLEVLTGAAYTTEELTLQLTTCVHLLQPLEPASTLTAPGQLAPHSPASPQWDNIFEQALEFFLFNLSLSGPVFRALYAVSSDAAISELSGVIADNIAELTTFGDHILEWLVSNQLSTLPASLDRKLPFLFSTYGSLFFATPETLDSLAGREITVETRPGNLGTLNSQQLAAIFYDTVQNTILPTLDDLGIDHQAAWTRRHRASEQQSRTPAVVAAVGIELSGDDRDTPISPSDGR